MRLIVLGAAGTYPAPGRPCSGYLVRHRDTAVLLDCGPGVFMALNELMDPEELDAVVISHVHPDHCTDLFALYHYLAYGPAEASIPVYVPEDAARLLRAFARVDEEDHPFLRVFGWRTVGGGDEAEIGPLRVRFGHADHTVPTLSMRLSVDDRSLAYSADTGSGGDAFELALDADLFLCEATWQSGEKWRDGLHLTAAEAGAKARGAGARALILTHLRPALSPERSALEAEEAFGRPVMIAAPTVEVKL